MATKKIGGTSYNVEVCKKLGFKQFAQLHKDYDEIKLRNVWLELTGEDIMAPKPEKKEPEKEVKK
jgi:hypothetical protein